MEQVGVAIKKGVKQQNDRTTTTTRDGTSRLLTDHEKRRQSVLVDYIHTDSAKRCRLLTACRFTPSLCVRYIYKAPNFFIVDAYYKV